MTNRTRIEVYVKQNGDTNRPLYLNVRLTPRQTRRWMKKYLKGI